MTTGIMICGHGSRDEGAVAEFEDLASRIRTRLSDVPVEHGFLEFATPTIGSGLEKLVSRGVRDIRAVPGMLFAAGHAKNDIPSLLNEWSAKTDEVQVRYGRELGVDAKMLRAAADRIEQSLQTCDRSVPHSETLLFVVGRGASDPDANSNVTKVMRLLWEGHGFGWGETAYSGVTFPLVGPALDHAVQLGFPRILVFPYFLFTGVLVQRIYSHTDLAADRYPDTEFIKVPYLGSHPMVVETVLERIDEIGKGVNNMNCQLCKYREQILGFEDEVGLAQQSHHHHVEGIGTGHTHHEHRHDHGHHHPYPHADHPLGPSSLSKTRS